MTNRRTKWLLAFLLLPSLWSVYSCQPVKAYHKARLNDSEMELSARKVQKFELNFQAYREGASGANGGKSGGGCGCN